MNRQPALACFFDAFGTLLYPRSSVPDVYLQVTKRYGETRSGADIGRALRQAMRAVHSRRPDYRSSAELERDYWRQVISQLFGHLANSDQIFDELWAVFADPGAWCLFDDVLPTLDHLARLRIPVGVASNFDGRLHEIVGHLFPPDSFRWILISADVGWRKPDPQFFRFAERQCGLPSHRMWMIGDEWQHDIQPAWELGWNSVLIDRRGAIAAAGHPNTHRIQSLTQIIPLLTG